MSKLKALLAAVPAAVQKAIDASGGREKWRHGKAIDKGVLRYVSASALQLGDSSTETGCARRHFYAYARGLKDPPSTATERGAALHAEVEKFLLTGDRSGLSSATLSGMPLFPSPGRDLWIEHDILLHPNDEMVARDADLLAADCEKHDPDRAALLRKHAADIRGAASLDTAPLRASGIPVVGKIDCMHRRGTNKGGSDIMDVQDPAGTVEVLDWKFVKNLRYAKTREELLQSIQMALYGKFVFTAFDTEHARLSLGYVPTSGTPRKVTARVSRDQVDESWNRIEALAGYLRDAAKSDDPDSIEANTRACNSYGRPCPASGTCRAAMTKSLASVVGVTSAENLLKKLRDRNNPVTTMTTPAKPTGFGSLGARLGASKPQPATPSPEEVAKEKARLARAAVASKYPGIEVLIQSVLDCGLGFPTTRGEFAAAVGTMRGEAPHTYKDVLRLEGDGELSQFEISSIEELTAALDDVRLEVEARKASATEAPAEVETEVAQPMFVPPETPESTHTVKAEEPKPTSAVDNIAAQADGGKKKRGRPAKAKPAEEAKAAETPVEEIKTEILTPVETTKSETPAVAPSGAINVYFNCTYVEGVETTDLTGLVDRVVADLNELAKPELDFRFVPERHSLAYGKWKPALGALIREVGIARGNYHFRSLFSPDITQVVVEVLRQICRDSGGVMVFGSRL